MRHYFWEYPRVEMRLWSRIRFEVIRHRFSFTLALLHSPWHTSFCASIWSSWQYICSLTKLLPLNVWLQFSQADSHISTKKHGFCRYTCSWYVCTFTLINDWYRYYKILILLHLMSNLQAYASIAVFFLICIIWQLPLLLFVLFTNFSIEVPRSSLATRLSNPLSERIDKRLDHWHLWKPKTC